VIRLILIQAAPAAVKPPLDRREQTERNRPWIDVQARPGEDLCSIMRLTTCTATKVPAKIAYARPSGPRDSPARQIPEGVDRRVRMRPRRA
jgi:hypothetical protein